MKSERAGLTVLWLTFALSASVWAEFDSSLDRHWELWKKTYNRTYLTEVEEFGRRTLWEKNLERIKQHNLEENLGRHSYTLGINQFSDLTQEEMLKICAPLRLPDDFKMTPTPLNVTDADLPASVDWNKAGCVTSVKNQGSCGSCWAFSTAGALEGLLCKTKKKLVDLSPQNLVDCSGKYGNQGCNGGWMHQALRYVIANQGIDSEKCYPYKGRAQRCGYKTSCRAESCLSYTFVPKTEAALKAAVATVGPIAIAIDASMISGYKSGVYYYPFCGQQLNHAVLLVGYGTDKASKMDYWLIKNSWGRGWGERGYIRMARNKNQMCGISLYAVYPK